MERKFRTKNKNRSIISSAAIGTGAGMLISVLLALFAALLISNEKLSASIIKYIGVGTMAISAFVSVQVGGRLALEKKLLSGGSSAVAYYLILVALTIILFEGRFLGIAAGTIAFFIGCGISVLLLAMPKGKGIKKRRQVFSR